MLINFINFALSNESVPVNNATFPQISGKMDIHKISKFNYKKNERR
jgi:hypothetical protein